MNFSKKYGKTIAVWIIVAMLVIGSLGLYRKFRRGR